MSYVSNNHIVFDSDGIDNTKVTAPELLVSKDSDSGWVCGIEYYTVNNTRYQGFSVWGFDRKQAIRSFFREWYKRSKAMYGVFTNITFENESRCITCPLKEKKL